MPRRLLQYLLASAVSFASAFGALNSAFAGSGITVRSQSATALGMSQAGMSTGTGDISTMIYNPATLAAIPGRTMILGVTGISTRGSFDNPKAFTGLGTPVTGGSGGDNGTSVGLPNFHFGTQIGENFHAGLSITSNYGLGTFYDSGWVGRYHALDSELLSVVLQPTIAWQATPQLSFGVGVQVQYIELKTSAALDYGTIDVATTGGAFGGIPGGSDGQLDVKTSDTDYGFVVGMLAEPWTGGKIGLSYRSAITHDLKGDAKFKSGGPVGAGLAAATGAFTNSDVQSKLSLPPAVYVGIQQDIGNGVTLYGDLNWLGWSRLNDLTLKFDNPAQPDAVTEVPWKDSIFAAAGASWARSERLTLRAGVAWDQSPARGSGAATPAIPDGDAWWVSGGASYKVNDRMWLDGAIGATFTETVDVAVSSTQPGNTFRGDYDGRVTGGGAMFAALQLRMAF